MEVRSKEENIALGSGCYRLPEENMEKQKGTK